MLRAVLVDGYFLGSVVPSVLGVLGLEDVEGCREIVFCQDGGFQQTLVVADPEGLIQGTDDELSEEGYGFTCSDGYEEFFEENIDGRYGDSIEVGLTTTLGGIKVEVTHQMWGRDSHGVDDYEM